MCRGGRYSFPGLLYFTLDSYLIMLSVKQGGIKYHFLSLWYDSTWDWTQVSRPIGKHYVRCWKYWVYKKIIYKNCCKKKSCFASNKVFIRWWPWVQAWFRGRSIITTNPGPPSSISQYYQTFLDGVWSVRMPYLFRCSYSLVLDLYYIFPLLCWWKSKFC